MKTNNREIIQEAISIMRKNGSIEFARKTAKEIINSSWKEIDNLLLFSKTKMKLKALADFLIERNI